MSGSLAIRNNTTQLAISGSSPTVAVAVAVPGPSGVGAGGTVTSVAVAVPAGLEVAGSPVTSAGTITISFSTGYALPTIAAVAQGVTAYGYGNHASAGYLTSSAAALAYQPLAAVLTGTTASFTTADEAKLDHISVTQAVDLDAIETRVNALDAAVVLKGVWDASAGAFPGSGTAQAGESWIVSVAGTVDSVAFAVGDRAIAITDNASTTVFASNWFHEDYTDKVSSVAGRTGAVTIASTDITDSTSAGRAILTAADAVAQRTAMGVTNFDPASPGTIGGTTPGAINATTISASGKITTGSGSSGIIGLGAASGHGIGVPSGAQLDLYFSNSKRGSIRDLAGTTLFIEPNTASAAFVYARGATGLAADTLIIGRNGANTTAATHALRAAKRNEIGSFTGAGFGFQISGSDAFASDATNYNGGPVNIDGGAAANSGAVGDVKVGETRGKLRVYQEAYFSKVIDLPHYTNATEPAFFNGGWFFNDDLDKARVGGAAAWETVTSI